MAPANAPVESGHRSSTSLEAVLWIAQAILAGIHGAAGAMKSAAPLAELVSTFAWTSEVSGSLVRFVGAAELAAAVAMLIPSSGRTRIGRALTPIIAFALAIVMMLATVFHSARGEVRAFRTTLLLCGLAAFVGWGRLRLVIHAK